MNLLAVATGFETPSIDWAALSPIIIVLLAGAVGVLLEAFVKKTSERIQAQLLVAGVALLAAVAALITVGLSSGGVARVVLDADPDPDVTLNPMVVIDGQSLIWQGMILLFGLLGLALFASKPAGEEAFTPLGSATPGSIEERLAHRKGLVTTEVYPLLMFAVGGMMLFTAVTDLVFLFVALEVFSLPLYLMVALARRRRLLSQEAALKYYLLGSFASAIYLFGAALVYGATGTTSLESIGTAVAQSGMADPILLVGMVFVASGLMFKIGAAPLHSWTPDAYQGAPTPVTAFMSAATKAAATAALIHVLYLAFAGMQWELSWLIWSVAIVSIAVGSVLALTQKTVKRMLAYSSVAHAGFIIVAFAGLTDRALVALPVYLLAYGLASMGAFAITSLVRETDDEGNPGAEAALMDQWAGLGKKSPWAAAAMLVFLLSFAGIPLTAGFIGKFEAFSAAIAGHAWPLAVVGVIGSAVSVYFYLRLVVVMYLTEPKEDSRVTVVSCPVVTAVVGIAAVLTILLGVIPGPVLGLIESAASVIGTMQ